MPLTPSEKLQRRATDPYFGLAEELAQPSLASQKYASLAAASVEKNRNLDPAQAIADEAAQLDGTNLGDIAQSSLLQGWEQVFDFFTGGNRTNEEILKTVDEAAGVSPEGRKRLVSDPQEKVIQSLAQGNFFDAAGQSLLASPGTLADSANIIPELAVGALGTAIGGRAIAGRRVKKAEEGIGKIFDRVGEARTNLAKRATAAQRTPIEDALKSIPKAAGQVSLATADITQRQINDFRAEHGVEPTRSEAAQMYALNLATMLPTPSIIKNLFVPNFRKQISTEIKTLTKNIKGGSNFKQIMSRVVDGSKKIVAAGSAEAGQEYFQTWAEHINVQLGPKERDNFWKSVQEIIGDENNQLQALAGAFLGGGAGVTARAAISVPAVTAGAALDTAKGTAKVAAKTVVGTAKFAGKQVQKVADAAAFKVLSEEEREVIRSEHESRKVIVDTKVAEFEADIKTIQDAETMEDIRKQPGIAAVVSKIQQSRELTDGDLENAKVFKSLKADAIRAYRGDIGLLKTELAGRTGANIAKRASTNIGVASVDAASAAVAAVSPGVKAVAAEVKQYGEQAVATVRELRSSTALGMIELAATAGKEETKQIISAARSLSMDDLKRTANVIKEIKPELAKELDRVIKDKQKALERAGVKSKEIVNEKTVNPIITDIGERGSIKESEVAAASSAVNQALAGKIEDVVTLSDVEISLHAIEKSAAFKSQSKGAMSRDSMVVAKRKLQRARDRIEKEIVQEGRTTGEKTVDAVVDTANAVIDKTAPAVKVVKDTVKTAADKVQEKVEARAKKRAEEKSKKIYTSELISELKDLEAAAKNPKLTDKVVERVPAFVELMQTAGIETRADFELFIEQFPGIEENVKIFKELDDAYPSNIIADELMDTLNTFALDSEQTIKEAYNRINPDPACKI